MRDDMTEAQNTKRPGALIAMSGGVDSSVAAWLMQQAGYDCTGITMRLTRNETLGQSGFHTCCSEKDIEDAAEVAFAMDIPYEVLDFTADFREKIIEKFIRVYEMGGTPNPCIDCNRCLKFGALLDRALVLGYDYIATGHYARVDRDPDTGLYRLLRGRDRRKDQSYVLYSMTQDELRHTLFPLDGMTKTHTRELARKLGFYNADKPDSQDICFVPDGDYAGFIEAWCRACRCEGEILCTPLGLAGNGGPGSAPTETGAKKTSVATAFEPGEIVNRGGRVLGEHAGLIRYTIGQRKGIGVAAREPLYVLGKDASANRLVVGFKDELLSSGVVACDVNLISGGVLEGPRKVQVKTHYRQRPVLATAEQTGPDELTVTFEEPQRAAAPGQAAVLYEGDVVLGGGTIARTF